MYGQTEFPNMKVMHIAPVADYTEHIVEAIKLLPVNKLVLMYQKQHEKNALAVMEKVSFLKIDIEQKIISDRHVLGVIEGVTEIVMKYKKEFDEILINVGCGGSICACSALSAAFVNGIKAYKIIDNQVIFMPVLKFSYVEVVSDAKLNIIRALKKNGGRVTSLNELSELAGMEKSLLSYHIRGGKESKGLEELGLIKINRGVQGKLIIEITPMGEMLLLGRACEEVPKC